MLMTMTNCRARIRMKLVLILKSKEGVILVQCTLDDLLVQAKMKLAIKQNSSHRETTLISFQIIQPVKMLLILALE